MTLRIRAPRDSAATRFGRLLGYLFLALIPTCLVWVALWMAGFLIIGN